MKQRTLVKATLAMAALFAASAVFAASGNGTPVGSQAKNARQVTVTPQTEYLNVQSGDVLNITLADGKTFSWKFDTQANYVSLADIAPQGARVDPKIRVYVSSPSDAS
ncbi:MAG: Heavy-metal resistance protein CzcE [Proteobacteria bacterium]|nr:Heavy-metal resistance protein CzcE [Pseudomonadota bacterium]